MNFIKPTGFNSFHEYWKFAGAREFRDVQTHDRIDYAKTRLEKLGDFLVYPSMRTADHTLRNIRNPLMILTATLTAILGVTILFYPDELIRTAAQILPHAKKLKPWMIKVVVFGMIQTTVLGLGIRTFGRLDPSSELWTQWSCQPRKIMPISIGTEIVKIP